MVYVARSYGIWLVDQSLMSHVVHSGWVLMEVQPCKDAHAPMRMPMLPLYSHAVVDARCVYMSRRPAHKPN